MVRSGIRLLAALSVAACTVIVTSCSSGGKVFDMVREGERLTPGTLAVITGRNKDQDFMLAKNITMSLGKRTNFKVISQDELGQKIPDYPYKNIVGEWGNPPQGRDNSAWLSPENIAAVNAAQKYIRTQYVYVVWTDQMNVSESRNVQTGQGSATYTIVVYGRLLAYPKGEVIGYTVKRFAKRSGCFGGFKSYNQEINELLKQTGRDIVEKINQYTAQNGGTVK